MVSLDSVVVSRIDFADFLSQYGEIKRYGKNYRMMCPIHEGAENDTSFLINGDTAHCFGCGFHGNVVDFIARVEHISYDEAAEKLADFLNIDYAGNEEYQKRKSAVEEKERQVKIAQAHLPIIKEYLEKRGFTEETIYAFKFGYDDGSLVIPIADPQGRTIAFARRQFQRKPKYVNSKNSDLYDKSATLFGLDKARHMITDHIYLVEGYMDAASGWQMGEPTVAYCGADLTKEQILEASKYIPNPTVTVIFAPDNDEEGRKKVAKVRERFLQYAPKVVVRVALYPDGIKDANDLLLANSSLSRLETEYIDIYVLKQELAKCRNIEAEYKVVEEFIKTVKNPMIRADIAQYLAQKWGKSQNDIKDWLSVSKEGADDILAEFRTPSQGVSGYADMLKKGGITLGFAGIDYSVRNLRRSDVVLYGAYSSVGKTWLLIQTIIHCVIRQKLRCLFFSLEMTVESLYERIIANILGISTDELEESVRTQGQYADIYNKIVAALDKYLVIIDRNNLTMDDINKRIKVASNRFFDGPVDVVGIDYFQYIAYPEGAGRSGETSAAAANARALKWLAKENNCVVICLSQLNRAEGSVWQKPTMKALKQTGDLENSGDIVVLFWRPSEDPKLTLCEQDELKDIIMARIEKGRRGIKGNREFKLLFNPQTCRIGEIPA